MPFLFESHVDRFHCAAFFAIVGQKTRKRMTNKKEKAGKIALDLMQKTPETRDPIELEKEMHKDYESNIHECIELTKKKIAGDFFVVVLTKKEKLLPNVVRNFYFGRLTCPTPDYDQTVYRYNGTEDYLEFMWVIPSKDTCELLRFNALEVHQSEKELLGYVLDFYDGSLMRIAKRLNKEHEDSPIIIA